VTDCGQAVEVKWAWQFVVRFAKLNIRCRCSKLLQHL